ncbi:MAG: hypothetical protein E7266_08140 [Lachnospiraceae bacterium]|nr:hypothetical protein [Lachnospiraceae bacterium]
MDRIEQMDKKTMKLFIEQKEMEVQLNLENNYREEAYENFKDFRELVYKYLEAGYIKEKKFDKSYGKRIELWEDIFEPKEEETEFEEDSEVENDD